METYETPLDPPLQYRGECKIWILCMSARSSSKNFRSHTHFINRAFYMQLDQQMSRNRLKVWLAKSKRQLNSTVLRPHGTCHSIVVDIIFAFCYQKGGFIHLLCHGKILRDFTHDLIMKTLYAVTHVYKMNKTCLFRKDFTQGSLT